MSAQQVVVNISSTGQKKIEAVGFTSSACLEVTKSFENALGGALEHTRQLGASCVDESELVLKVNNS